MTSSGRSLLTAGAGLAALGVLVGAPGLLGEEVLAALGELREADPAALWLGALSFVGVLLVLGRAWRVGVRVCGGTIGAVDAVARYSAGAAAVAILPAGLGGLFRIGLYSRALPEGNRLWTSVGIAGAIDCARALGLVLLVVAASSAGALPLWPALLFGGVVAGGMVLAFAVRNRTPHARLAHLLDAARELARAPRAAVELVGWVLAATAARVAAAVCVATAVGVERPLVAGLVIVAAISVAGFIQFTPGNVGVASGAIAVALHLQGVDTTAALSAGIAFHALESAVSMLVGGAGLLYLARPSLPGWTWRLAGSGACLAVGLAVGATVFV